MFPLLEKEGWMRRRRRRGGQLGGTFRPNLPPRPSATPPFHGGVGGRTNGEPRGNGEAPLPGAEQIYVVPYSWADSPWWSDGQVRNLGAILDTVKRNYNVDENRVVISGVSDGGTGAYYIGM